MSASKTGALIVITNQQELKSFADTGEVINATLSTRLIENIFFKNAPLHDGALIIQDGMVWSAACILPISKRTDLPKRYGLRHRAALGLTEKTDATAIVVSEETGNISVAKGDTIKLVTPSELEAELTQAFGMEAVVPEESKQ
jgi:DNA integrity scanning protein DisA with diadenylate cyclase activity